MKPKILVLKADGTNCDEETKFAFELAGGTAKIVHVNELRSKQESLKNYQILALPGGFSYGDDVVSGKILATELTSFFQEELKKFIERKNTLIIGICNGFQVLVRTGLLPFGFAQGETFAKIGKMEATLTNNDSGKFECRWINLKVEKSKCVFLENTSDGGRKSLLPGGPRDSWDGGEATTSTPPRWHGKRDSWDGGTGIVSFQVAHGEGKFLASPSVIKKIEDENLVAFRYTDENGNPTQKYPQNPNGSINAIAGICDPTGRILGLMPHPERFVKIEQHPNWRRMKIQKPFTHRSLARPAKPWRSGGEGGQGLPIFKNMIDYVKNS